MEKKYGFLFIVVAATLWSLDGLLRRSLYSLPPTVVVLYEHIIGLVFLLPFALKHIPKLKTLDKKDIGAIIWIAFLGGVLGTVFYTTALGKINYIQFSVVILLQKLQPIFVILTAKLLLKEPITKNYLIWALVAMIGAYFISFPTLSINFQNDLPTITAALFAVAAAFCWGSSTSFNKYALRKVPSEFALALRFLFTIPLAFIFVLFTNSTPALTALSNSQLSTLVLIALSTGMVAMVIYFRGLKYTPARLSAIAELAWPVSALFIGYYFFHERLVLTQIVGAAILLFSMLKVTRLQKT
ncbi:MAG: DMT superfamily drug/metabolite permease [Candidatus Gottesmanbacteria bacterium GW2011_GWB1_43_11]|uniref:DMT superfamily drug/metabolite permease n=1 Tax=Candidatus Gottesmanbacteria bacterium GW2011_GWB1_43_11 TaxID=1618446 RepID=A0A0G1CP76_9BACT|nr:MAG: DMT superfamily drug/metabolite permease [Candidatus Gottesmanbacteria bacterium GW2011_GWA2_42_16]KKS81839.1 MAG: hypothetical protein UV55_C0008G0054 [Candidatus Gottesmanbacteria bacterium GW2011_GWC1_43_10]KKS87354.1 MAG: DMT superfamily drug/metabolite permease [Candidatus Gottesmanbacteria bacterium GW2011_GWB1_43_11]OGG25369.1 MAG: hypothetical protein A3A59_02045 [Candidatus Gottesmanbacteria bacterium RIFCSPLOWO2_01_FULL_42_10]